MTWEWVAVISILIASGTIFGITFMLLPQRIEREVMSRLATVFEDVRILNTRVKVVEDNQGVLVRVADETKKMLSQQQVASALGIRGAR